MLHLYHSNRLEQLADLLAEQLSDAPDDPFLSESVVVQHQGMGRWLSLQLAKRLGICANLKFPLPAGYIWQLLKVMLPDTPDQDHYQPDVLQWRLFERLSGPLDGGDFSELGDYLKDADELRCFELAGGLATVFDQYLVYRPDWIVRWEAGNEAVVGDHWQATLWRELMAGGDAHWVGLGRQLVDLARRGGIDQGQLPPRVMLFAVSSLSVGYLEILSLLSQQIDVHLFLLNPSEGHWVDLISREEKSRRELMAEEYDLYLDVGNPLLSSLGGQGRDFFSMLLEFDPGAHELFVDPDKEQMLSYLQQDILQIHDGSEDDPRRMMAADDNSIQFHACHSPMREVEVLHDQLLALFDADSRLQADDILVLTPDMDSYAPYIEAVFSDTAGGGYIPFSLADRGILSSTPLISGLFNLLALRGGRYEVNQVIALLELPAVRRCFNIEEADLPLLREWIEACGIRWGRNESTRTALGLPPTDQNSWQAGLDRLVLGYALPPAGSELFHGVRPYGDVEGSSATPLGGLLSFTSALFDLEQRLGGSRPLSEWASRLEQLLDRFFTADGREEAQLQAVRESLSILVENAGRARFSQAISLDLVVEKLRRQLEVSGGQGGFLSGGVTFCALTPMRSLPFKVICMIGMNDGAFPRHRHTPGFDLMEGSYRPGDRSRRADDRYLFLETLLSARHSLYFSYVGQDIRDNSRVPPSVLLSEVLDYLDQGFVTDTGVPVSEKIVTHHPLQAFNLRYFTSEDERLFSYSNINCDAAGALIRKAPEERSFFDDSLSEPGAEWRQVELDQLIYFFTNPTRYLLQKRLGIRLESGEGELESRDPFELGYRQRNALFQRLVTGLRSGETNERITHLEQACGELPHGAAGEILLNSMMEKADQFAEQLSEVDNNRAPIEEPVTVELTHGEIHLTGTLQQVAGHGILGYSINKLPAWQLVELWINHLALNHAAPDGIEPVTVWLDGERMIRLNPVDNAGELLGGLLELYWRGLSTPLHLFPKSSRAYALATRDSQPVEKALKAAEKCWYSNYNFGGEGENPYYKLVFDTGEQLDAVFCDLSERLFLPLLNAMEEV
ncbi:MAG: exodeoxyribonuclease V subunit gamma [Candidatus Sedimenticola sp. (ex Thyasira tokunagai)]